MRPFFECFSIQVETELKKMMKLSARPPPLRNASPLSKGSSPATFRTTPVRYITPKNHLVPFHPNRTTLSREWSTQARRWFSEELKQVPNKIPESNKSPKERVQQLIQKYGKIAIGTHLVISTFSLTSWYLAIKHGLDVVAILKMIGLQSVAESFGTKQAGRGSSFLTS
jgi:hypothetical protein